MLAGGGALSFDKLLLATGAEPIRLKTSGADLPHVRALRSLADSRELISRAQKGSRAVVVGASFIGLETAAALRHRDVEVHADARLELDGFNIGATDGVDALQRRPDRMLRIVLMGSRVGEIDQDPIAHVLGDKAVEPATVSATAGSSGRLRSGSTAPASRFHGAVLDSMELTSERSFRERGILQTMTHGERTMTMPTWPVRFDCIPTAVKSAPLLGEHTAEVLADWLGLDAAAVAGLRQDGIV
jgi:hypothetical protein